MLDEDVDFLLSPPIRNLLISHSRTGYKKKVNPKTNLLNTAQLDISRLVRLGILEIKQLKNRNAIRFTKLGRAITYFLWEREDQLNEEETFKILRRMELEENGKLLILDAGCGTGTYLLNCLKYNSTALVFGIDRDPIALMFAKRDFHSSGLDGQVLLKVGDIHYLPYNDNCFDAVLTIGTMGLVDVFTATAEFSRVLKTGGKLYMRVPGYGRHLITFLKSRNLKQMLISSFAMLNGLVFAATGRQLKVEVARAPFRYISFTITVLTTIFKRTGLKMVSSGVADLSNYSLSQFHVGQSQFIKLGFFRIPKYYDIIAQKL